MTVDKAATPRRDYVREGLAERLPADLAADLEGGRVTTGNALRLALERRGLAL